MACLTAMPADGMDLYGHVSPSATAQYNFTGKSNISTASFALSWNDSGSDLDMGLLAPDGSEINHSSADNSSIFYFEDELYRHLILNNPKPGRWDVSIRPIEVPPEGADFCLSADLLSGEADALLEQSTAEPGARFDDTYSGQGANADSYGLYGQMDVSVGIDVARPGNYSIKGWLCDASGNRIISSEDRMYLDAGIQKATLSFNGMVIRARLAQGPLSLRDLDLTDGRSLLIDHRDIACDFPGRQYSDFRAPLVRFTGSYSDRAVDPDPDGKFDGLVVDVGLDVSKNGHYSIKGDLYDQSGRLVSGAGGSTFTYALPQGQQEMDIEFDGFSISDAAADGTYQLRNLGLYTGTKGGTTLVDYLPEAYTTSVYDYHQFRVRPARIGGILADYGSDINGDGLYDFLTAEAQINVSIPGNYTLSGELYDGEGKQMVWCLDQDYFGPGSHKMYLDFDGKTIWGLGINGAYSVKNLTLYAENWTFLDDGNIYTTAFYNSSDFVDPVYPEKIISGSGSGELLVTISASDRVPAFHGRYSYDLVGANVPPISSILKVGNTKFGHSISLPGAFIPNKPNNFTVQARGVKSLNIGLKKDQSNSTRTWVTAQIPADEDGVATIDNDLLSPGRYQFKIFGEAADNATWVDLCFTAVKKIIIQGDFSMAINTSGLPSENYSISAKALNGSFSLDDLKMNGLSFTT